MNVLITSASRKVSLVRSFQSALVKSGGGCVVAVDSSPYAPALYLADRRYLVPPSSAPEFIDEVARLCQVEGVSLLIPTRDEELSLFAEVREKFLAEGVRVMVPSADTVKTCSDKLRFLTFCGQHNFDVPRTFERNEWKTAGFPLFVKPRFGKGGHDARRVESEQELQFVVKDPEQWVVQECVTWPEVTIDLLADFGGRVISVVPRLRKLVIGGESYVSETIDSRDLIAEARRLATEAGLVGHNTIQCFWNGNTAKFIEVNPRFGGAASLSSAAGADSAQALVRMASGENLPQRIGEFRKNLFMLRFTEDLFIEGRDLLLSASSVAPIEGSRSTTHRETLVKAVLFDLDNTLYPEEQFVLSGFRAVARTLGERMNLSTEAVFANMLKILKDHGRGKVFDRLLEDFQIDSATWLPTLVQVYRSHQPLIFLFPGVTEALRSLKDRAVKIGLVTDGLASVQRRKIAALGLDAVMDVIVCTEELGKGCRKPSTAPFEIALQLLNVPGGAAAYVADDVSKDFAGPNRLGMKSVQIRSTGLVGVPQSSLPKDPVYLPGLTVESLDEALRVLELD